MVMSEPVVVKVPRRWTAGFCIAGALVGLGAAFVVRPVLGWLLGLLGDAPAPLRLAGLLPLPWAVPVLMLAGLVAGLLIAAGWSEGLGRVEVGAGGVRVVRKESSRFVPYARIAEAYADADELVLADARGLELLRAPTDGVLLAQLEAAFAAHGLRWRGRGDPREAEYRTWVDGEEALEPEAEELLRSRGYALMDKKEGEAFRARESLLELGIVVRDRDGNQQFRRVEPPEAA